MSEYCLLLRPDLLVGGHSFVMDRPRDLIERYYQWSLAIREDFRELSAEGDYRLMFDPYWVRVDPYRARLDRGDGAKLTLLVRNVLPRAQTYRVALHLPEGISAEPAVVEGAAPAEATVRIPIRLKVHAQKKPGISLVGLDTTLGGKRYGEWFDFIVEVPKP